MPENAVIDWNDSPSLDATFEGLEEMRASFAERIRSLLEIVHDGARLVHDRWGRLCREVAAGNVSEVHRDRARFERFVDIRLAHLKRAFQLIAMSATDSESREAAAELPRQIAELERFRDRVFGAWNSPDDLEELAAADYPLSTSQLKSLCQTHSPPRSWFDQTDKPF